MSLLLLVGLGVFAWTASKRLLLLRSGASEARLDQPQARVAGVLRYVLGQARMFRYWTAGVAHAFIFAGFVILGLRTLILIARGYSPDPGFGFWLFDEGAPLGAAYTFLKDLIGVFVIVGIAYFLYQRLVVRPERMSLSSEGVFILCMILGLIFSDLGYEAAGFVRAAGGSELGFHAQAPAASLVSFLLFSAPMLVVDAVYHAGFWAHTIIVLAFLNFLPHGKHFHVLTVIPNVYFQNLGGIGRLRPIQDIEGRIERGESLGIKGARDLTWKGILDLYTCTECGRCSDNCPAFNTGKLLSPKQLSVDLRDHLYRRQDALIAAGNVGAVEGSADVGSEADPDLLVPQTVDPQTLWACTTCGACEQECPVFITYVDKIVDMRRHLVMERGEFPEQLQNAFRGLESVGNVYSFANEQRADWAQGLDIPLRAEKPDAEYLYWVGCAPSFDDRSRRIARATAQLLKTAGVDFAILGPQEMCTGDPARRAGNEYLYQTLAKQNCETLNAQHVRKIVATCPHCFNTIKNEYPEFGGNFQVIHHSELLGELVRQGRLKPQNRIDGSIVYHDSCYLGRYNNTYDAPRELLRAIPGLQVFEAPESRDRGMCCGAGGAQMWKEEEAIVRPESRAGNGKVNHARTRQLLRVLPSDGQPRKVASACQFCMTMLGDGLKDQGHTDVEQADVAELLWRSVQAERSDVRSRAD